jgi:probable F420-dependent oxidoreductase
VNLGRIGIWRRRHDGAGVAGEIEALGYGALWIGASPGLDDMREYLEATSTLTIATGILNVWQHEPAQVASQHAELTRAYPGRFLLGIGIGHPEATQRYAKPLTTMREYFDALDVPREELIAAALGPKMLDLAAERSLGTHPYFTPPAHTRFARERVGPDAVVAPELAVVVDTDAGRARTVARSYAKTYLGLRNYTSNLMKFGFAEADIADGGSDRLIDTLIPHGDAQRIAEAVHEHLEAGADHVCLQPLGHGPEPVEDYRALAAALI